MLLHDLVAPRQPVPAGHQHWVVVLHGLGDSKEGWKDVAPMLGLDRVGWVFVQAPRDYFGGWSWFDIASDLGSIDFGHVRSSRAALEELLSHLEKTLGVPSSRLVLMGFSQGCLMTLDVGLRSATPFAGLVAISGWLAFADEYPAAFGPTALTQKILQTHGRYDGVVPIERSRPQAERLKQLGVPLTWVEYDKEHGLDPEREIADIRAFITGVTSGVASGSTAKPARS